MIAGVRGRSDIDLGNGKTADDVIAELRHLPEVAALDRAAALQMGPEGVDSFYLSRVPGRALGKPPPGCRGPALRGLDEMAINRTAADVLGKRVGDTLELQGRSPQQAERFMLEGDTSVLGEQPEGPKVVLRIAGIVEGPGDIGRVDRHQVGATLAVQATAVTAVGLVVGLPLGIAAGRHVWVLVASGLSVVRQPVVPASVLVVALAAIVVANLMAVLPARRAAAIRPAEVLHAE